MTQIYFKYQKSLNDGLKLVYEYKIVIWICFLALRNHRDYFIVKKLVSNVRISGTQNKKIWAYLGNPFLSLFSFLFSLTFFGKYFLSPFSLLSLSLFTFFCPLYLLYLSLPQSLPSSLSLYSSLSVNLSIIINNKYLINQSELAGDLYKIGQVVASNSTSMYLNLLITSFLYRYWFFSVM